MSMLQDQLYRDARRQWATTLCGCYSYRDKEGKKRWWPTFCCTAMICTNMLAGRVCSKTFDETPMCCELGCCGSLMCVATLPVGVYHPAAGMGLFCLITNFLRYKIIQKYNVEEEKACPCDSWNTPLMEFCHFGCNYPCALFQMYVSLDEWQKDASSVKAYPVVPAAVQHGVVQPTSIIVANPIPQTAVVVTYK